MIYLNESVCVGQFAKKSCSNRLFARLFSRVPVAVNHGIIDIFSGRHIGRYILQDTFQLRSASCLESGCCCPAGSRDFSVLESSSLNTVIERTATRESAQLRD